MGPGMSRSRDRARDERAGSDHRALRADVRRLRGVVTLHARVPRCAGPRARATRPPVRHWHRGAPDLRAALRPARRPHPGAARRSRDLRRPCGPGSPRPAPGGRLRDAADDQRAPGGGAGAITNLADAIALAVALPRGSAARFEYGWARGTGSAAFIVGTLLSGQVVSAWGLPS